MTPVRVIVLVGSPADPHAVLASAIGEASLDALLSEALGEPADVSVISWLPAESAIPGSNTSISVAYNRAPTGERILRGIGLTRLRDRLSTFPAGRLANSFSPVDQSRLFARAVARDSETRDLVDSASILVAADLPAVRAAWTALRHRRVERALFGMSGALTILSARSSTNL